MLIPSFDFTVKDLQTNESTLKLGRFKADFLRNPALIPIQVWEAAMSYLLGYSSGIYSNSQEYCGSLYEWTIIR